ncbi:unnamed protein product [Effrenium voratum]|uniref:Uncharacterized protein n=1 Tax=Effrenium voratum TaxID=2562239 RepID=A0AA36J9Y9_9DINO|nr:unnamed protein product [Effrenium voratum]
MALADEQQNWPDSQPPEMEAADSPTDVELDGEEVSGAEPEPAAVKKASRNAYYKMRRFATSPRITQFPHIAKIWRAGSEDQKKDLLSQWVTTNGNASSIEATLNLRSSMSHKLDEVEELLTIKQMKQRDVSQRLSSCWQKIDATVASQPGVPDPACPASKDDVRYWITMSVKRAKAQSTELESTISGRVDPQAAFQAMNGSGLLSALGATRIASSSGPSVADMIPGGAMAMQQFAASVSPAASLPEPPATQGTPAPKAKPVPKKKAKAQPGLELKKELNAVNNLHLDLPLSQAAFKDDLTTAIATWQKMEQWNDGIQGVADEVAAVRVKKAQVKATMQELKKPLPEKRACAQFDMFCTARALRQSALKEARAHQKLRAADLTFDALVTYCTLPVQDEQGMQVEALVRHGYRDVLGTCSAEYWQMQAARGITAPGPDSIPLLLFGDEAEWNSCTYMALHWMADCADVRVQQDSRMSRYLICVIPSHVHCHEEDSNINYTLQAALQHIAQSFDCLRAECSVRAQLAGIKGDWKFLCQALNSCRTYNHNSCCLWCDATRDGAFPYTDVAETASWRSTLYLSDPWVTPPALATLGGISSILRIVHIDLMHAIHLGVGRDLVGSVLYLLVHARRGGAFRGSNIKKRFRHATSLFLSSPHSKGFPKHFLMHKDWVGMRSKKQYVECHSKAAQTGSLIQWLADFLGECTDEVAPRPLKACVWCLNAAMTVLFKARAAGQHTLTDAQARQAHEFGYTFLKLYLQLHASYRGKLTYKVFNPRPKYHLLCHLFDDLVQNRRNPARSVNFMDEDSLRKTGHIIKKCHAKTAALTVLQRYLVGLKPKMQEAFEITKNKAWRHEPPSKLEPS